MDINFEIERLESIDNSGGERYRQVLDLFERLMNNNFTDEGILIINKFPTLCEQNIDSHYVLYRKLANYYGKVKNIKEFKKVIKKCKGNRSPKWEIDYAKGLLLESVVREDGFEEGLKMLDTPLFNNKKWDFQIELMNLYAKYSCKSLSEIDVFLERNPDFNETGPNSKSIMYMKYIKENEFAQRNFELNFDKIYDHLKAKPKYSVCWDAYDLALLTDDVDKVNKLKKLVYTPAVRKDFKEIISNLK